MTLQELIQHDKDTNQSLAFQDTDKYNIHNYVEFYYDQEFAGKQNKPISLLEIGLAYGASARLWRKFFKLADIWVVEYDRALQQDIDGVSLMIADAYSPSTVAMFKNMQFDYIIDDGDHHPDSQVFVVKHWAELLKPGGKLIIEDVQAMEYAERLQQAAEHPSRIVDLRGVKEGKRYVSDDIIFEMTKQ